MAKIIDDEALARIRESISRDEVLRQVDLICRSATFDGQRNAQKLLRYLVAQTIAGSVPTQENIALVGLEKEAFDPGDSQVRGETGKLRRRLDQYYDEEAAEDEIVLSIPDRQYVVFWRHSSRTLLGTTEETGRIIRASTLSPEEAKAASRTSELFWPQLTSVFPVYCDHEFATSLDDLGELTLPVLVRLFFESIANRCVFITSLDKTQIRIYPINVWLVEWARLKRSNDTAEYLTLSSLVQLHGEDSSISDSKLSLPGKLWKLLAIPETPYPIVLRFHTSGYIYFSVPKPILPPVDKCEVHLIKYAPMGEAPRYYYVLVTPDKEGAFLAALAGKEVFDMKSYGYVIASGEGEPPGGLTERLLTIYKAVTQPSPTPGGDE